MVVKIEVIGLGKFEETAKAIYNSQRTLQEILLTEVKMYGQILERQAKEKHLSGPTTDTSLSVRSDRLRSSIRAMITEDKNDITINFGTDVPYAAIHEFGGEIHRSTAGTALKRGKPYDIVMPKRSFLGASIDETYPEFQAKIAQTLVYFAARGFNAQ